MTITLLLQDRVIRVQVCYSEVILDVKGHDLIFLFETMKNINKYHNNKNKKITNYHNSIDICILENSRKHENT